MLFGCGLRKAKVHSHWAYLLGPGVLSWFSFYQANIHPGLGLGPDHSAASPRSYRPRDLCQGRTGSRSDTLNEFEHFWKTPVEVILGLFGLANAGVVFSSLGTGTWLVLAGLLIGKPLGITLLTLFAEKGLKLEKPAGMDYRHVVTLGMVAGIGFTVALFVSVAAFTAPGAVQDSVKMGALLSFGAAPLAILLGKFLGIRTDRRQRSTLKPPSDGNASQAAHEQTDDTSHGNLPATRILRIRTICRSRQSAKTNCNVRNRRMNRSPWSIRRTFTGSCDTRSNGWRRIRRPGAT